MEERDLDLERKEIVGINKDQELKLLEFMLLVAMITQILEWVMVANKDHKAVKVVGLDLDLLAANPL